MPTSRHCRLVYTNANQAETAKPEVIYTTPCNPAIVKQKGWLCTISYGRREGLLPIGRCRAHTAIKFDVCASFRETMVSAAGATSHAF